MRHPVGPTEFKENMFDSAWYDNDFFFSPDGVGEFPEHHCKITWEESVPFIKNKRNAVDIGCRDGEYTRYLCRDFQHVFCFDYRRRKLFHKNVDLDKITHFKCALGEENKIIEVSGGGSITTGKIPKEKWYEEEIFTLDQFELPDIDYIKIDVDGFELRVLQGAQSTIEKYSPILVLEQEDGEDSSIKFCQQLGYRVLAWDKTHRNVILGK